MSLKQRATRRLGLLAGSSLVAASLAAAPAMAADTVVTIPVGAAQTTAITASPVAPDTYTVNILGALRGANNAANTDAVSLQGSGTGAVVIHNNGRLQGRLNFPTASGPITLNNNTGDNFATQGWHTQGISTFGSGADLLNNAAAGLIHARFSTVTFAFGAGNDRFANAGRLVIGFGDASLTGTLVLTGLETFENSGLIILGPATSEPGSHRASDRVVGSRLIGLGTAFTGSGDSRIALDANLSSLTQADCATASVADCLDFTGGSTAGSTVLTVTDVSVGGGALNAGITLIVGSSAAEHFSLDPNVPGYVQTDRGEAIQTGLVGYRLVYDSVGHRHMLVGTLADEAFQGATFATVAQETWRATTGGWFDRQADLRATPGGLEPSKGLWARGGFGVSERQAQASYDQAGTTYTYNVDHKQKTAHMVVGADVFGSASQDSAWVIGVMAGMTRADVEYQATPTEAVATGAVGGLYASWIGGALFIDASVTGNVLDLKADAPNMQLGEGVQLTQTLKSVGARIDAGWRVEAGQGLFAEPLVSMAVVRTRIEDIDVPGGGATFDYQDRYNSSRVGAGLRAGVNAPFMGGLAAYSLTGRYWNESEGANASAVVLTNGATSTPVVDELTGGFTELGASINVYSAGGGVSGFVNVGGKVGDDYSSQDASVGVRLRW